MTKAPSQIRLSDLLAPQEPGSPPRLITGQRPTPRAVSALIKRLAFLAAADAFREQVEKIYGPRPPKPPEPQEGES
jgi:hypothetical protein